MLFTLLNLPTTYLVLILIAHLLVGLVATGEMWYTIFPISVTSVSHLLLEGCYRIAVLVIIACSATAILHLLIGGGINAH